MPQSDIKMEIPTPGTWAAPIYQDAINTQTGEQIFPWLEVGSELNWSPQPVG